MSGSTGARDGWVAVAIAALLLGQSTGASAANPFPADGKALHEQAEAEAAQSGVEPKLKLRIPVESAQGFRWSAGHRIRDYTWSGGVVPTIQWARWQLGLDAAATYRPPEWDVALGPRVGYVIPALEVVAFKPAVEVDYFVRANSYRFAFVQTIGLGELAYVRLMGCYDLDQETYSFLFGIGVNVLALADPVAAVLTYSKNEDLKP